MRRWLTAVDASTGAVKWKYQSKRPMVSAVTATKGDVVFTGELTVDFLALDARDGKVLYRFNTGGGIGGVVTYEEGGKQYRGDVREAVELPGERDCWSAEGVLVCAAVRSSLRLT
jgi:glucose dehydrogenase